MKKILLLTFILSITAVLNAQNITASKEKITQVLQSEEDYLYADQTCNTVEQALQKAQSILMREIEAYLQQSGENNVVNGMITEQMVTVTVQRGDKYRAFVYINKAELGSEKNDAKQDPTQDVEVTLITEENDILVKIAKMTSRLQVYDYINELKKDGESISFYEHPNAEEQDSMYLILYKRGGNIEAILTPTDGQGIRRNLTTGKPDSKTNHPTTSVNGFIYER